MTSAEAKLRAATERTGAQFTESDLSPLRLPATTYGSARGSRFPRGLAAFAAAAALLAVMAGSLVLTGVLRHRGGISRREDAASVVASGPLAGIPRYFVELCRSCTGQGAASQVDVIDSVSGRVVASVAVPEPYQHFSAVAGAADDRTFVLGAERWSHTRKNAPATPFWTRLFVLRIDPRRSGRMKTHLAPLGLKVPVNWEGYGLALSPDGTRLAFAASPWTLAVRSRIWVYSMTTGTARWWQDPGQIARAPWDARSLSWSPDDRTLAYFWDFKVDLLDTRSGGGDLLAHSRTLIVFSSAVTPSWDAAELTPDGTKVIASMFVRSGGRIDEFSAATGRLMRSITPTGLGTPKLYDVLWTNSSGSLMIVELATLTTMKHPQQPVVLLRGTKLTLMHSVRVDLSEDVAW